MPRFGSKNRRLAIALGVASVLAVGCQRTPAPNQPAAPAGGGGGTPTATPTPTPSATASPTPTTPTAPPAPPTGVVLDLNWANTTSSPFMDPTTPTDQQSGRYYVGNWTVQGGLFEQTASTSAAALSFREYNGDAFKTGTAGQAPSHYRVDAEMMAFAPSNASASDVPGAPVGMLGLIPYYLDSSHYVLLDVVGNEAECWFVDGLQPQQTWDASKYRVWNKDLSAPYAVGQKAQWGAEIDTKADTVKIYYNGLLQQVIPGGTFLQDGVAHGISLVSNGNFVGYDRFTLTAY